MDLYAYTDYRKYLRDFYESQKSKNPAYSYRVFANRGKLVSPNYLKLVIDGKRRITEKTLSQFIRGLSLTKPQASFFASLVAYQESKDPEAKSAHLSELLKAKKNLGREVRQIAEDRHEILRKWHHWAIREMVLLKEFSPEPQWIAKRLRGRITPKEAQESWELLQRLEFIKKGRRRGQFVQSEPLITTSDEISSLLIRDLHRQFIELGVSSIFNDPIEDREISGLTLAVRKDKVPELKRAIKEFRRELNRVFSDPVQDQEDMDEVYHMTVELFPITRKVS